MKIEMIVFQMLTHKPSIYIIRLGKMILWWNKQFHFYNRLSRKLKIDLVMTYKFTSFLTLNHPLTNDYIKDNNIKLLWENYLTKIPYFILYFHVRTFLIWFFLKYTIPNQLDICKSILKNSIVQMYRKRFNFCNFNKFYMNFFWKALFQNKKHHWRSCIILSNTQPGNI